VKKSDEILTVLTPGKVSALSKNQCPLWAGIAVRFEQESVSALSRNRCPEWSGISVRYRQEYASSGVRVIYFYSKC